MALYEYHCPECHTVFEKFLSLEQRDEPQICPNGHPYGRRQFASPAIIEPDRRKTFRQAMSRTPGKHFM